jgi:hypothetical protein
VGGRAALGAGVGLTAAVAVVLDDAAVQALSRVTHPKHRHVRSFIEEVNQRDQRRRLRTSVVVPVATPSVHRTQAVLAACPNEPASVLGGGVLVRWSERGTSVVVTTPGSGEANQRLVMVLAGHVHLVGPRH